MKNKIMLFTDGQGNFGHAIEKTNHKMGNKYLEVRMLGKDYDIVHTTNWTSFLIFYEVLKDLDPSEV